MAVRRAAGYAARRGWLSPRQTGRGLIGVLVLVVALMGLRAGLALASDIEWQRIYQNTAFPSKFPIQIAADASGAYVIGRLEPSRTESLMIVQKYNTVGNIVWENTAPPEEHSNGQLIASGGDGAYIVYWINSDTPNVPPDVFLRKYNASGFQEWTRRVGQQVSGSTLAADASGAYLTAGTATPDGSGGFTTTLSVFHYDPAGNQVWSRPTDPNYNPILVAGGGAVYVFALENSQYVLYRVDASGTENWRQTPIGFPSTLAFSAGGVVYLGYVSDGNGGNTEHLLKYAADGSVTFNRDITSSTSASEPNAITGDDSGIYNYRRFRSAPFNFFVQVYSPDGVVTDTLDTAAAAGELAAAGGNVYVLGTGFPDTPNSEWSVVKLVTSPPTGRVVWGPNYPEKQGQGVAGATVQLEGGQPIQTDVNGYYTLSPFEGTKSLHVTLPATDIATGASSASAAAPRAANGQVRVAADGDTKAVFNADLQITGQQGTAPTAPDIKFGASLALTALGQTVNVQNLVIDKGSWSGQATLALKYADGSPPLNVNVDASYAKGSDTLTLKTNAGNPSATWGGQTLTLTSFEYTVTPLKTPASGSENFTLKGTANLVFGPVTVNANIIGARAANGDKAAITLTASGTATVDGVTISFDSLSFDGQKFNVTGNLKLPNQAAALPFAGGLDPKTGAFELPLSGYTFDGHACPVTLKAAAGTGTLSVSGTCQTQLNGKTVDITLLGQVGAGHTVVQAQALMDLDPGKAKLSLTYDFATNTVTADGTYEFVVRPCPGKDITQSVKVTATREGISFTLPNISIPINCDTGQVLTASLEASFNGQLASLNASAPFKVNGQPAQVTATLQGDPGGTKPYLEFKVGFEMKFGGATGSQGTRAQAASDVRILITNPFGRRSGFDPATGQIVNEISGVTYLGLVGGVDSFSLPGRLGGYTATITSQTAQQVTLRTTVNGGAPSDLTVNVGPNGPAYLTTGAGLAANGQPATFIGPAQAPGCLPRPNVQAAAAPGAAGQLAVTISATAGPGLDNKVREVRFGAATNAVVDVGDKKNQTGPFTFTVPGGGSQTVTLTVRRATPGQATTVPLTVVDTCGEWPTFVGGGPNAF